MFGLFRRKPKYTAQQIFEQLGESAKGIMSAATETDDIMVALKGAAVVSVIIKESKRCFGLNVRTDTIFARLVLAVQEEDLTKMAEMTKEMANALGQVQDPIHRGGLIYFWFNGDEATAINNGALEKAMLLIEEDFDGITDLPITDLPIELQNTIANIYYDIAQMSLNHQRGEQFPTSLLMPDNRKKLERYIKDSVFFIESRKSLPRMVSDFRRVVLKKHNQSDIEFMTFALLCLFKYRIPDCSGKSVLRCKFEIWRRRSSVDEIENLYKLFQ